MRLLSLDRRLCDQLKRMTLIKGPETQRFWRVITSLSGISSHSWKIFKSWEDRGFANRSLSSQLGWNLLNLIVLSDQLTVQKGDCGSFSCQRRQHGVHLAAFGRGESGFLIVSSHSYHQIPWPGRLKQTFMPHGLAESTDSSKAAGKSKMRCWQSQCLLRALFQVFRWLSSRDALTCLSLPCTHLGRERDCVSDPHFIRTLIWLWRPYSHDPI